MVKFLRIPHLPKSASLNRSFSWSFLHGYDSASRAYASDNVQWRHNHLDPPAFDLAAPDELAHGHDAHSGKFHVHGEILFGFVAVIKMQIHARLSRLGGRR